MIKRKDSTNDRAAPSQSQPDDAIHTEFPFNGEKANSVFGDDRHAGRDTTYLEVSPEELIDVAKHFAGLDMGHQETIERAYRLICEAHLISDNIRRWNEKVRRHHSSESIFVLVDYAKKNEQGRPLRQPLLVAFFESIGMGSDATNASKRFNEWFRDTQRLQDYSKTIKCNPNEESFDPKLYEQLLENGWVEWFLDGSSGYLVIPQRTKPTKVLRKPAKGEHVTTPYWGTNDVWWPEAAKDDVDKLKSQYLNKARDAFLSDHHARKALEKFKRWIELEELKKGKPRAPIRPRNSKGELVSPRDKGAGRALDGTFGKK